MAGPRALGGTLLNASKDPANAENCVGVLIFSKKGVNLFLDLFFFSKWR